MLVYRLLVRCMTSRGSRFQRHTTPSRTFALFPMLICRSLGQNGTRIPSRTLCPTKSMKIKTPVGLDESGSICSNVRGLTSRNSQSQICFDLTLSKLNTPHQMFSCGTSSTRCGRTRVGCTRRRRATSTCARISSRRARSSLCAGSSSSLNSRTSTPFTR